MEPGPSTSSSTKTNVARSIDSKKLPSLASFLESGAPGSGRGANANCFKFEEKTYKNPAENVIANHCRAVFDQNITSVIMAKLEEGGSGPIDFEALLAPSREQLNLDMEHSISVVKSFVWCIYCQGRASQTCCGFTNYCSRECQLKDWDAGHRFVCKRVKGTQCSQPKWKAEAKS